MPEEYYLYGKCYTCDESSELKIIQIITSFMTNTIIVECECGERLYIDIGNFFEHVEDLKDNSERILASLKQ